MGSHPRRRRLEEGIYRDRSFLWAVVQAAGHPARTRTFPFGTEAPIIRAWRAQQRSELLLLRRQTPRDRAGVLAADVPAFLDTLPTSRRREDFAHLMQHWIASPLGQMARQDIRRTDILTQRARWLEAGVAIVSINHRLRALRKFFDVLDGEADDVRHPTDKIRNLRPPTRAPRAIPIHYVETILDAIPDHGRAPRFGTRPPYSELKIRLRVIAWTGIPPVQLERLRPRDVDFANERLYLQPRQKGKGSPAVWVRLLPQAVEAFTEYARVGLWGRAWSRSSMAKSWKTAIQRVKATLHTAAIKTQDFTALNTFEDAIPPRCRPYDLRHSFGTELYRITGDLPGVAEMLQHASLDTTKGYTGGAVSERVDQAIAKMKQAHPYQAPRLTLGARRRGHLQVVAKSE